MGSWRASAAWGPTAPGRWPAVADGPPAGSTGWEGGRGALWVTCSTLGPGMLGLTWDCAAHRARPGIGGQVAGAREMLLLNRNQARESDFM